MGIREEIEARFRSDISRVRGLVGLYQSQTVGVHHAQPEHLPDLLRAAVVLLHASLEGLFRSIAEWKLPTAAPDSLERIPLAGLEKDKEKFTLVDLAEFRGRSVDSLIEQSVTSYLLRSTFNHPGDLSDLLRKVAISFPIPNPLRTDLSIMMTRRHWIAHRVDRDLTEVSSPLKPQLGLPISTESVEDWIGAVVELGESVLKLI